MGPAAAAADAPSVVEGGTQARHVRGDARLLTHCRLFDELAARGEGPREQLRREVGDRFAGVLVAGLVAQSGRRGSSSP